METLTEIPFAVDRDLLMKQTQVEAGTDDAKELLAMADAAEQVGRPKAVCAESFIERRDGDTVHVGGVAFTSRTLSRNLEAVERVFPMVATCGREMDEASPADGDMLKEFWWDLIKNQLLRAADRHVHDLLLRRHRLSKTSIMRPGSGDATVWPIEQQLELFALLGDVRGAIGVVLTDSFLMIPNKTVSGILFPTEKDFRSCEVCHRENCPSRQAPFNKQLWEELAHD